MSGECYSHRACPVCEQDAPETCWDKEDFEVVRCRACSMVYSRRVPLEVESGAFYRDRALYLLPDKLQSDYAPVRFSRELRIFRGWVCSGAVLDVGCSTGGFLHELQARYPGEYNALGTDLSVSALNYARSRGVPVSNQSFLDMSSAEKRYDAITFWAVLEHLVAPGEFLAKAAQLLKPGGFCFILVPNLRSLAVRLLGARYRYIMAEHLNYFSPRSLKRFAGRENAFEIVQSGSTHFNPVVIWQDVRSRGKTVSDQKRAELLQRTTAWKQKPLLKPLNVMYSAMERLLARMYLADNCFIVLRSRQS